MKVIKINKRTVYRLLKDATWDYEYCGETPNAETMKGYTEDIPRRLRQRHVNEAIEDAEKTIYDMMFVDGDINEFTAMLIADWVGQAVSDCKYPGVTFKIW
jgi:hypothetical protein